ncbi:MAG: hypothetical protein H0X24_00300 [Ktedonobacterales bacterium]|nr:hypothetical protein [Ktedonobacterales bacterium]
MSESSAPPPGASAEELRTRAHELADQLGERRGGPRWQIVQVVRILGIERTQELVTTALAQAAQGGELTRDGQRQRTTGGIFFQLVRQLTTKHPRLARMFMAHPPKPEGAKATPPPLPPPPARWEDRLAALAEITEDGRARTMKLTLTGRPGTVVDKGTYILTTMPAQKMPAFPKGLPALPPDVQPPQTVVMVAKKQWQRVEAALSDPEDMLVLEGFAMYEPSVKGLVVLAMNVTTSQQQRDKRAATPPSD